MKAIKKSEPYEIRDEINSIWENNRKAILQTAAVVTVAVVVVTAFFLGRHKLFNALINSKWYNSGMELTHKIANTAGTVTHKVVDAANAVTHKVMDTAETAAHQFSERAGVSTLN